MHRADHSFSPPISESGGLAAVSLVVLVAGATIAGSNAMSAALVAAGLGLGVWPIWTARGDVVVRIAGAAAIAWMVYGAMIGSLPSAAEPGRVADWATTEGRILVCLLTTMIASSVRSAAALRWMLAAMCVVVTAAHAVALAIYLVGWSPPLFPIENRDLFFGLASSHHVVAFLSAGVALVAVAAPAVFPRWFRWTVIGVSILSIGFAGSRSALLGMLVGLVVIAWFRLDRRRLWQVLAVGVVLVGVLVAVNGRFRTTASNLVDPGFFSAAAESFTSADPDIARGHAESEAEANALLRLTYWGEATDQIIESPLIGMGSFRQNDVDLEYSGVRGVVYLATDGTNEFNDREPHNVILYLLLEVGIIGLGLFVTPYVIAWRRTSVRRDDREPPRGPPIDPHCPVDLAPGLDRPTCVVLTRSMLAAAVAMSMVSSGVLATGLGLIANSIIFASAAVVAATDRETRADLELVGADTGEVDQ